MEAIVEHCYGLDEANKKPRNEVRTFGTVTAELQRLRGWLQGEA